MKVALFNLIYQRYHKANEAESYTNVNPDQNLFCPRGEKVRFESDRKGSLGPRGPFFSAKCFRYSAPAVSFGSQSQRDGVFWTPRFVSAASVVP